MPIDFQGTIRKARRLKSQRKKAGVAVIKVLRKIDALEKELRDLTEATGAACAPIFRRAIKDCNANGDRKIDAKNSDFKIDLSSGRIVPYVSIYSATDRVRSSEDEVRIRGEFRVAMDKRLAEAACPLKAGVAHFIFSK